MLMMAEVTLQAMVFNNPLIATMIISDIVYGSLNYCDTMHRTEWVCYNLI